MLIKIDNGRYINTDHICYIVPTVIIKNNTAQHTAQLEQGYAISFSSRERMVVSDYIAGYIITLMQPEAGFIEPTEHGTQPPQLSLRSRIALYLKEHPSGCHLSELVEQFGETNEEQEQIAIALSELLRERVIDTDGITYVHRANPTIDPPPIEESPNNVDW